MLVYKHQSHQYKLQLQEYAHQSQEYKFQLQEI